MEAILYVLAKVVAIYLSIATYAIFGRVILQFFVVPEESRLYALLFFISEPFIMPFRIIFARFHILEGLPIDMPFMVGCVALTILQAFMPII